MYGFLKSQTCDPIFVNAKKDCKKLISVPKRAVISQKKIDNGVTFFTFTLMMSYFGAEIDLSLYNFLRYWTSINLQYFLKSETDASNCQSNLQYFPFKEDSSIHQK